MPQFDIYTFAVQTLWLTAIFFIFYFFYLKLILNPTFVVINIRTKILKMSLNLAATMKQNIISDQVYSRIFK